MELPIFSDNLKSSASWTAALAREQEAWSKSPDPENARALIEARIREAQVKQALEKAERGIDRQRFVDAATLVSSWAAEPGAKLDVERFLALHRRLTGIKEPKDLLRQTEPSPINASHDPTPSQLLPRMLDNAFDWFTTPSFNELHPVEQAAVVYLRLLDLHPFPIHTETTALLAASFYTQRGGLPPLIIYSDEETRVRYAHALEAAFRMLTQPLVEFFAEMLTRTMRINSVTEK